MKFGKAGKAAAHAAYIAREAQYARRLHHGEGLEAKETGNLPAWADTEPNRFWQAADTHERANGTTYREMEIALPRELTPAQRFALVRGFVAQELGERHAYQWAIHNPNAADGHEQPHVHLMFSERRVDGIERDPERYFRRHNPKAPEKGGAKATVPTVAAISAQRSESPTSKDCGNAGKSPATQRSPTRAAPNGSTCAATSNEGQRSPRNASNSPANGDSPQRGRWCWPSDKPAPNGRQRKPG